MERNLYDVLSVRRDATEQESECMSHVIRLELESTKDEF